MVAAGPFDYAVVRELMFTKRVPKSSGAVPGCAGYGSSMHCVEAEALIKARGSTVWDIITDARNYAVWASGITHVTGEPRNGGTIRIRTRTGGSRVVRLRVQQMPGEVMTWTGGLPLGLFTGLCTFTLDPEGGMTRLRVNVEFTGLLRGVLWNAVADTQQALIDYVNAVKKRAEILG
ncbi:Ribosome association toxin PasT (RatA) of the RatAB toxin-antitoxin module [Arthrobacter sp. ov407]|nr:Ribosome association toxin PasT (RatA) of the RatAB toxin-antitoxin module [Arthrobacter sp. ov407]